MTVQQFFNSERMLERALGVAISGRACCADQNHPLIQKNEIDDAGKGGIIFERAGTEMCGFTWLRAMIRAGGSNKDSSQLNFIQQDTFFPESSKVQAFRCV